MSAPMDPSLYALLEVSQAASPQEIEGAYQRVSGLVAPDSLAVYAMLEEAEVDLLRAQVQEAYDTLRDPARRAAYDAALNDRQRRPAGHSQRLRPLPASDSALPELAPQEPSGRPSPRGMGPSAGAAAWPGLGPRGQSRPAPAPQRYSGPSGPAVAGLARAQGPSGGAGPSAPVATRRRSEALRPQGGRKLLRPAIVLEYTESLEVTGPLLRQLRESAQASLEDVSESTKISKRYLMALEADDWANLPATVYVRGFVSQYARALGLEPREVAKSYMIQYQRHRAQSGG